MTRPRERQRLRFELRGVGGPVPESGCVNDLHWDWVGPYSPHPAEKVQVWHGTVTSAPCRITLNSRPAARTPKASNTNEEFFESQPPTPCSIGAAHGSSPSSSHTRRLWAAEVHESPLQSPRRSPKHADQTDLLAASQTPAGSTNGGILRLPTIEACEGQSGGQLQLTSRAGGRPRISSTTDVKSTTLLRHRRVPRGKRPGVPCRSSSARASFPRDPPAARENRGQLVQTGKNTAPSASAESASSTPRPDSAAAHSFLTSARPAAHRKQGLEHGATWRGLDRKQDLMADPVLLDLAELIHAHRAPGAVVALCGARVLSRTGQRLATELQALGMRLVRAREVRNLASWLEIPRRGKLEELTIVAHWQVMEQFLTALDSASLRRGPQFTLRRVVVLCERREESDASKAALGLGLDNVQVFASLAF